MINFVACGIVQPLNPLVMCRLLATIVFQIVCILDVEVMALFKNPYTEANGMAEQKAEQDYEVTHRVYLDIHIEEQRLGGIVIGLYGQVVPITTLSVMVHDIICSCCGLSSLELSASYCRKLQGTVQVRKARVKPGDCSTTKEQHFIASYLGS